MFAFLDIKLEEKKRFLTEWYQAFPYTGTTAAINDIRFVNEDIHRYDLDLQSTVSIVTIFDSWQVKYFALCYSI
jgi:hypothetical protein